MLPSLSVHIVASRPDDFEECLHSIRSALGECDEIFIVVNGDHPAIIRYLEKTKDARIRWQQVEKEHWSVSRNRAFTTCSSDIIYFLDDDVTVPRDHFDRCRSVLDKKTAILGGPNITPPSSSWFQKANGAALSSKFIAPHANTRYRRDRKKTEATADDFILCNFAIQPKRIPKKLIFNERLFSNQENLFAYKCEAQGLKLQFEPSLFVFHKRRRHLKAFARQILSYGTGRAHQYLADPHSCKWAYLVPTLSLIFIVAGLFYPPSHPLLLRLFGVYLLNATLFTAFDSEINKQGIKVSLGVILLAPLVHCVYGIGILKGLIWRPNTMPAQVPREQPHFSVGVEG